MWVRPAGGIAGWARHTTVGGRSLLGDRTSAAAGHPLETAPQRVSDDLIRRRFWGRRSLCVQRVTDRGLSGCGLFR